MNSRKIDYTQLAGFGLTQDGLDFMQVTYLHGFAANAKAYGHKIIVAGVEDLGTAVSDGYVVINGELMPFVGGPKSPMVWLEDVTDSELFGDSSQKAVYTTRRARMGVTGVAPLAEFRRWKTDRTDLDDSDVVASAKAVKKLNDAVLALLGFEPTIILKGCAVTNVAGGNLEISTGTVLIGGALISSPAYTGAYPVYLPPSGIYTTVEPSAGLYVTFDPYTSQRYVDVLRRATTPSGEVKTFKTLSDRFDAAGLGRWEMTGFKICDDLQSRVPLGYDRRTQDPVDNTWDIQHTVVGTAGGEKRHQLTIPEMPRHRHKTNQGKDVENQDSGGSNNDTDYFDGDGGPQIYTDYQGGDLSHENRQPFRVVVFAERI